jgi:predicted metal-dependent TIM-barrel fold hydrolase
MFDTCVYPQGLSDDELAVMRSFGIDTILARAKPATFPVSALSPFSHEIVRRCARNDVQASLAIGVHPSSRLSSLELDELAHASLQANAIGPTGLVFNTASEREALAMHCELALMTRKPLLVTAPKQDSARRIREVIALVRQHEIPPSRVAFENCSLTSARLVHHLGYFCGLTIHHEALNAKEASLLIIELGAHRFFVGSGAGNGPSDILAMPHFLSHLKKNRFSGSLRSALTRNANRFFGVGLHS